MGSAAAEEVSDPGPTPQVPLMTSLRNQDMFADCALHGQAVAPGAQRNAWGQKLSSTAGKDVQATVDGQNPAPLSKHGNPLFVGIFRGVVIPRILRWCEMDVVHPQYLPPTPPLSPKGLQPSLATTM